jgi:hypothetical protein
MSVKNTVKAEILTSIDASTLSPTYQPININGLQNPCFMLRIINNSDKDVTISYDGIDDHEFVSTLSTATLLFQTNSQPGNHVALMPRGITVYAKGTAGSGFIYLSAYYQPQGF